MDQLALPTADCSETALKTLLGDAHVMTAAEEREFFSSDVYRRADIDAALVLSPGTAEELGAAIA